MSENVDTVYVVVDPNFGERLTTLPAGFPVWVVDSPANKAVALRLWKKQPEPHHLSGITTYSYNERTSAEENLLKELDVIDLHHGSESADPPYTKIVTVGTPLSDKIKLALANYGFHVFSSTPDGFVATRQVPTTQT